jgi:molybdenum cofactor cytidylyltransferase
MTELQTYGLRPSPPAREPLVAGMLLAAGESSRMGVVKALLPFDDRTFVEHLVDRYRGAGLDPLYVVLGHRREEIIPRLPPFVRVAVNPYPEAGQLSSLKAGLEALGGVGNAVLVGPVDQATVAPQTLAALLEAWKRTRARAVVPRFEGQRGHPVILARAIFPGVFRAKPSDSLRSVLESYASDVHELEVDDPRVLLNVNNPADYRRLLELYGLPHEVTHGTGWEGFVASKSKSGRE